MAWELGGESIWILNDLKRPRIAARLVQDRNGGGHRSEIRFVLQRSGVGSLGGREVQIRGCGVCLVDFGWPSNSSDFSGQQCGQWLVATVVFTYAGAGSAPHGGQSQGCWSQEERKWGVPGHLHPMARAGWGMLVTGTCLISCVYIYIYLA